MDTIQTLALISEKNTEKNPGELKRISFIQSPVKNYQLTLVLNQMLLTPQIQSMKD